MSNANVISEGRLPQLDPATLSPKQKNVYQEIDRTWIPWANASGFTGKTEDDRFVGPFNAFLYSPDISEGFMQFQNAESKSSTLTERVRQVVILSVGSIWKAGYEIYAHSAVARKAGLSEQTIQALASGESSDDLSPEELIASRFARQLTAEYRIDSDLYTQAVKAFGQNGVMDMIFLIGIYLFTCAVLNAFEVPVPTE